MNMYAAACIPITIENKEVMTDWLLIVVSVCTYGFVNRIVSFKLWDVH